MKSKIEKLLFSEVCKLAAKRGQLPGLTVRKAATAIFEEIVEQLKANKSVSMKEFGTFFTRFVPGRKVPCRPGSSDLKILPAHLKPKIKFSNIVTRRINESF